MTTEDNIDEADLYTDMRRHTSAYTKALAAAEWGAMDARGNLPADWPERRAEIVRQFREGGQRPPPTLTAASTRSAISETTTRRSA